MLDQLPSIALSKVLPYLSNHDLGSLRQTSRWVDAFVVRNGKHLLNNSETVTLNNCGCDDNSMRQGRVTVEGRLCHAAMEGPQPKRRRMDHASNSSSTRNNPDTGTMCEHLEEWQKQMDQLLFPRVLMDGHNAQDFETLGVLLPKNLDSLIIRNASAGVGASVGRALEKLVTSRRITRLRLDRRAEKVLNGHRRLQDFIRTHRIVKENPDPSREPISTLMF